MAWSALYKQNNSPDIKTNVCHKYTLNVWVIWGIVCYFVCMCLPVPKIVSKSHRLPLSKLQVFDDTRA